MKKDLLKKLLSVSVLSLTLFSINAFSDTKVKVSSTDVDSKMLSQSIQKQVQESKDAKDDEVVESSLNVTVPAIITGGWTNCLAITPGNVDCMSGGGTGPDYECPEEITFSALDNMGYRLTVTCDSECSVMNDGSCDCDIDFSTCEVN